jgi:hypothetical protein
VSAPPPPPQKVRWRVAWRSIQARRLDEVRRELGIEAPERAHPGGVLVFEGDPAPAS